MRAFRTIAARTIQLDDLPPAEAGEGEVVVAVRAVGLCGTDHHIWDGSYPPSSLPLIQGHEIVGVVRESRAGALGPPVGATVVVDPKGSCGRCFACRRGHREVCEEMRVLGVHVDGGLRDELVLSASRVVEVGPIPPEIAVLAEPASIALEAVRRAEPERGDRCVVTGAGPIGLFVVAGLVAHGAQVAVIEPDPWRRALARRAGASLVLGEDEDVSAAISTCYGGEGPRVCVEASGAASAFSTCLELVRASGVVVAAGISGDEVALSMLTIPYKGLDVRGSRNARASLGDAAAFVGERRDLSRALVTHRVLATRLDEAFALLERAASSDASAVGKVVVEL